MLIFVFLPIFLAILFFFANRWNAPEFGPLEVANKKTQRLGQTLSVTTWNLGYAGLGAKADFIVDGGTHIRALGKSDIIAAVDEITNALSAVDSDVIVLQENAEASFLTRGVSVRRRIEARLTSYSNCFWSDFNTRLLPNRFQIRNGMTGFSRVEVSNCTLNELPQERGYYYGMFRKHYAAMLQRFPIVDSDANWVIINIHLAAFDSGAEVRGEQISALFDIAQQEYHKGNYVIIGGDWNLRISLKDFPHNTADEHLFWVFDFPREQLPTGWEFATDETTPTVRTLHKPFVEAENYTMIVDGFAVSPNVTIDQVHTTDFKFKFTDHHPVSATFSTHRSDSP